MLAPLALLTSTPSGVLRLKPPWRNARRSLRTQRRWLSPRLRLAWVCWRDLAISVPGAGLGLVLGTT
ncbi:MAG: hypothetical protein IPK39_11785 [Sulfuritalea sp.]|nr:hypothetical protein [Sulfuritalea sp.]